MRIDSHQHFWQFEQAAYPWIQPSMSVLRRDYLPADLEPLIAAAGIDGVIAVQAQQTVDETRWLLSTLLQHDTYHAGEINHLRSLLSGEDRWMWQIQLGIDPDAPVDAPPRDASLG